MTSPLTSSIQALKERFQEEIKKTPLEQWTPQSVKIWSQKWLKKEWSSIEAKFQEWPQSEKKSQGKSFYEEKKTYQSFILQAIKKKDLEWEEEKLAQEKMDLSLPRDLPQSFRCSHHPVVEVERRVCETLRSLGFVISDTPEVEHDDYNFRWLNFASGHSARDLQDSFALKKDWYLRTHTSSGQIHNLRQYGPPLAIASPGRVYRAESDATHLPVFHQIEGFVVNRGIHLGHLRFTLETFLNRLFGLNLKIRFRSSFFPFTEPSLELDMQCHQCQGQGCSLCKQTGWLELGGCGQIHRNVLKNCHIEDPEITGFAFGFGLERLALMLYRFTDLREVYKGDLTYLNRFGIGAFHEV